MTKNGHVLIARSHVHRHSGNIHSFTHLQHEVYKGDMHAYNLLLQISSLTNCLGRSFVLQCSFYALDYFMF